MSGGRQSEDWNRAYTAASNHSEASRHTPYLELLAEPIPGGDAKRIRARRSKLVNLVETMPENAAKDLLNQLQDPSNPLGQLHGLELHRATARQLERKLMGRAEGHDRGVSSRSKRPTQDGAANPPPDLPSFKGNGFIPPRGKANLSNSPTTLAERKEFNDQNRLGNEQLNKIWEDRYFKFILDANREGLPAKFLMHVKSRYEILPHPSRNFVLHKRKHLYLTGDVLDGVAGGNLAATSSGTIYHESTHAYLNMMKNDLRVSNVIQKAIGYYKNAPLKGSDDRADAPYRLLQEAAGTYVEHKISHWLMTRRLLFGLLSSLKDSKSPDKSPDFFKNHIGAARSTYNKAQNERVFGYLDTGWGIFKKQTETSLFINQGLRLFLDREILEGKFSKQFDVEFQDILGEFEKNLEKRGYN